MNPQAQSSNYFYGLELVQDDGCPIEVNSGLAEDPRYTQQSSSAFITNEYSVQEQSGVQ